PAVGRPGTPSARSRLVSSPAVLRVNVSASTWSAPADPLSMRWAMRLVSTLVLPDPAPARMHSGAASVVTANRCASFNPSSTSPTEEPGRGGSQKRGGREETLRPPTKHSGHQERTRAPGAPGPAGNERPGGAGPTVAGLPRRRPQGGTANPEVGGA